MKGWNEKGSVLKCNPFTVVLGSGLLGFPLGSAFVPLIAAGGEFVWLLTFSRAPLGLSCGVKLSLSVLSLSTLPTPWQCSLCTLKLTLD